MKIPEYVKSVTERFYKNGFECYIVGGAVRDALSGKTPEDYDLTTSAKPDEMLEIFSDMKLIKTGLKHGTVTVVSEGRNLEITTFRIDGSYSDNRHPDKVAFSDKLSEDLSRRDFTVNAMAYSEKSGLVDLFGGEADIKNRVIRTVGDPEKRFSEDGLRIMRGLRFAATTCFDIEKSTAEAMHKCKDLLKNIAVERLFSEFTKLLSGENAVKILAEYPDVIGVFIPEILPTVGFDQKSKPKEHDVYSHILNVLGGCNREDKVLRLTAFFHDIGKPDSAVPVGDTFSFAAHAKIGAEIADRVLTRLHTDTKTKKEVVLMIAEHATERPATVQTARRMLSEFGKETTFRLLELMIADRLGTVTKRENAKEVEKLAEIVRAESRKGEFSVADLKIDGNDLKELGFSGEEIGKTLKILLDDVIDGKIENEKSALLYEAKNLK